MTLIVGLGGTLRDGSLSRAALEHALRIAVAEGAATEFLDLRDLALPMHVPDLALHEYPGESIASIERLLTLSRGASAFVWSSPTYHGTISGILKNAIDMLEPLADDEPPYLTGRAVGMITIADPTPMVAMASCAHELRGWVAPTRLTLDGRDFTETLELSEGAPIRRATRLVRELLSFCPRGGVRG